MRSCLPSKLYVANAYMTPHHKCCKRSQFRDGICMYTIFSLWRTSDICVKGFKKTRWQWVREAFCFNRINHFNNAKAQESSQFFAVHTLTRWWRMEYQLNENGMTPLYSLLNYNETTWMRLGVRLSGVPTTTRAPYVFTREIGASWPVWGNRRPPFCTTAVVFRVCENGAWEQRRTSCELAFIDFHSKIHWRGGSKLA